MYLFVEKVDVATWFAKKAFNRVATVSKKTGNNRKDIRSVHKDLATVMADTVLIKGVIGMATGPKEPFHRHMLKTMGEVRVSNML